VQTVVYFYTMSYQQPPPAASPPPTPPQQPLPNQWVFEQNRAVAERQHDRITEIGNKVEEAAINGGNLALRMVLLINGGAAVALLSFMGGLPKDQRQAVASALAWFAWGVVAAASALGLAYFTNFCVAGLHRSMTYWYEPPYVRNGPHTALWRSLSFAFLIMAVLAGVGALVFFVVGVLRVKSAFINL
jgi:hypothetical protein